MPTVLRVLGEAGVPGVRGSGALGCQPVKDRTRRSAGYRLWVGASVYGRAESTLVRVMPELTREAARHADSAWR